MDKAWFLTLFPLAVGWWLLKQGSVLPCKESLTVPHAVMYSFTHELIHFSPFQLLSKHQNHLDVLYSIQKAGPLPELTELESLGGRP